MRSTSHARRLWTLAFGMAVAIWGGAVGLPRILAQQTSTPVVWFYCPMHPEITSAAEGTCTRCGMKLLAGDPLDFREYLVEMTTEPKVVLPGRPVRLAFTVRHPDTRAVIRDFQVVHDKRFHLFVLGHDLEYYDHVHPEMTADGSWVIDLALPRSGYFKLFTDFLPVGGTPQVVPQLLITAGTGESLATARAHLPGNESLQQTTGGTTLSLSLPPEGLVAGREETLRYQISDATTDRPVRNLEPYLAVYGHTLIVSEDTMEYVHAHPIELVQETADAAGGPDLTFKALLPKPGRYRLWTQIKRDGVVSTARFTVSAASPAAR